MSLKQARLLRRNMTDAEGTLWRHLRGRRFRDFKFRRQHPMGSYILDFICWEHRLVVEVDGGQHAGATDADAVRTAWLEAQGFRVIRFWNTDVLRNIDGVLLAIADELSQ